VKRRGDDFRAGDEDLFEVEEGPPSDWAERLFDHLSDRGREALPFAEEAVRACPGDSAVLHLACVAALMAARPERCLRFLKRLERRYHPTPAHHLLRALAIAQQGRGALALEFLARHGLDGFERAWPWFPGGHTLRPWLMEAIRDLRRQARRERSGAPAGHRRAGDRPRARKAAARGGPAAAAACTEGAVDLSTRDLSTKAAAPAPFPLEPLPRFTPDMTVRTEVADLDRLADAASAAALGEEEGAEADWYRLRAELAHLGLLRGFDELLCLPLLRDVESYWYQIETVRKVLRGFRGRVLLADEVGLGKTVEAGMVLKEYLLRGMVERFLVLAPAGLVGQWAEELSSKFGVDCATTHDPRVRSNPAWFWARPRVIASIATARREPHASHVIARSYDLVIVDEAHHLRNRRSANHRLVDRLKKRFLLLLSATPVHNSLVELYNLLTLLKPGIFKTEKEFRAAYVRPGRPRQPLNRGRLRDLMRDVMVRNTRALVDVRLPPRHAATLRAEARPEERACYEALSALMRELAARAATGSRLALRHLLTAAGSSPAAARVAIERFAARHGAGDLRLAELGERYRALGLGAKERALLDLLGRNPEEKKMVFVHHRATLEHLARELREAGVGFSALEGRGSGPEREAAVMEFRERVPVLLCTGTAGEGWNLQFCNTLVNFDLPWSPMAIEQRIGRLHRIGQRREVFVFNLALRGSIEDQVLKILDEKLHLFELVVGEVDAILGELDEETGFEDQVLDAWIATTAEQREAAFDALGERLAGAKRRYEAVKALDDELFGDEFATD